MKIIYDPQADVLSILFNEATAETSELEQAGISLDYDKEGNLVKLEISKASKRIANPQTLEDSVNSITDSASNQPSLTLEQRRAFLKLPLEERRCLLKQQAAQMANHYQHNPEWKELLAGDIIDY